MYSPQPGCPACWKGGGGFLKSFAQALGPHNDDNNIQTPTTIITKLISEPLFVLKTDVKTVYFSQKLKIELFYDHYTSLYHSIDETVKAQIKRNGGVANWSKESTTSITMPSP